MDGLIDCLDPDCSENEACIDTYEGDEPNECSDGIDNDSDGWTDCMDPDCSGSPDCQQEDLSISPNTLNWGTAYVGCSVSNQQVVTNISNDQQTITSITFNDASAPFSIIEETTFPVTLQPGESLSVTAAFEPTENGSFSSNLVVAYDNSLGSDQFTSAHQGMGEYSATYQQTGRILLILNLILCS